MSENCPTCGATVASIFDHVDGCPEPKRPVFGEQITVDHKLVRKWSAVPRQSNGRKDWVEQPIPPRTGIYIGYRTLANGEVSYGYDEGNSFKRKSSLRAWVVVLSEREKPIYVLPR